jgi:MoaA/NifB/PqqE/SkfB family radical SAM enzyme
VRALPVLLGTARPRELSTAEAEAVIDELQRMQVFYVNVGGGEPTVRPDFWHLLDYAIGHDVGVKFSTNGVKLDRARRGSWRHRLRRRADLPRRRHRRGQRPGPWRRLVRHRRAGAGEPRRGRDEDFKVSVVVTRENAGQLDAFKALTDRYGAQLRITRLRPSGRGPTSGTSCTPPRPSSASCTRGCWPTASRC